VLEALERPRGARGSGERVQQQRRRDRVREASCRELRHTTAAVVVVGGVLVVGGVIVVARATDAILGYIPAAPAATNRAVPTLLDAGTPGS